MKRVKVIAGSLVVNKEKVLCVQEMKTYVKGKWNIPAGHVELNESISDAAVREVKEETGIDTELTGLLGIYQHRSSTQNNIVKVVFTSKARSYRICFPKDEIMNVKWIDMKTIKEIDKNKLRTHDIKDMIDDYETRGSIDLSYLHENGY